MLIALQLVSCSVVARFINALPVQDILETLDIRMINPSTGTISRQEVIPWEPITRHVPCFIVGPKYYLPGSDPLGYHQALIIVDSYAHAHTPTQMHVRIHASIRTHTQARTHNVSQTTGV